MDITQIGVNSTYISNNKTDKLYNKQSQDDKLWNTAEGSVEPTVIVDLSKLAKSTLLTNVNYDASGPLEFRDSGLKIRMDSEALLESMMFEKGSVEEFISKELSGVMKKAEANLVAVELGQLINSTAWKNGTTIEERAVNRESGVRLAEHFANTYINDSDKRDAFMESIRAFAERDAKLDKGYYRWDDQMIESYKPPPSVLGKSNMLAADQQWSAEAVRAFEANEKRVTEQIAKAIASMNDDVVTNTLERLLEKLSMITDTVNEENPLSEVQWVLDISDKYFNRNRQSISDYI